ncbi:MAG: HD domain-containing protein [Geminicoccaceae bacterium]
MRTVEFKAMKDGTREDYALLAAYEKEHLAGLGDRILAALAPLAQSFPGYKVTRLEHSLQTASRALRDGADTDWIVTALLHDIGDDLAPYNHDSMAATILQPYVREECAWVLRHHGLFQLVYYGHHVGLDPNARDKHRGHPCYDAAVTFCERWDQAAFDPDYPTLPLETFEPLVREVFAREAWSEAHLRPGVQVPLVRKQVVDQQI